MLRKIMGWGVGNDVNVPYMHAHTLYHMHWENICDTSALRIVFV